MGVWIVVVVVVVVEVVAEVVDGYAGRGELVVVPEVLVFVAVSAVAVVVSEGGCSVEQIVGLFWAHECQ